METFFMTLKVCFKCLVTKPITEFYKHSQMADGHINKCKSCAKSDVKIKYAENIENPEYKESERKRGRAKYHKLYAGTGKANHVANQNWMAKFPEKRAASISTRSGVKKVTGKEMHHWSYNVEHYRDVIFLTKKQHMKAHRFIIYDQERMMYRRYDSNELLETKQKHEDFILKCIDTQED